MSDKTNVFVYCTLSSDQRYTNWTEGGGDLPIPVGEVFIKGGANVASNDHRLDTPAGVVTEVTPEQLAILEANSDFQLHKKNGFILVSEFKADPEKAAVDMAHRDGSAPLTMGDMAEGDEPASIGAATVEGVAPSQTTVRTRGRNK